MIEPSIRNKTVSGLLWKFSEKIVTQFISVLIQIILARILLPEDYGIIALITVFIALSDVFILQGFTTALIQKKEADDIDFSSVFFANLIIASLLYTFLYISSDRLALFYDNPILSPITKVLSLNIIFGAFSAVHNAYLSKKLDFKKSFYRKLSYIVSYGLVGIILAYSGLGVWALVYARVSGTFLGSLVLWISVPWKPQLTFSISRLKQLFKYSSKILGSNLFTQFFYHLNSLLIGKFHPTADLGYYQKGRQIPELVMGAIDGTISEVMYPTFSNLQNNVNTLKSSLRRSLKTSYYLVLPILVFLFIISEPLTILLLTEKWINSVPIMKMTCVVCMFWPMSLRMHALNALGKSEITFKLSIVQHMIGLLFLCLTVKHGILIIMQGTIITSVIIILISSFFVKKFINYSLSEMFFDILPNILLCLPMALIVYLISLIKLPLFIQLVLQTILAIITYLMVSKFSKNDNLQYLLGIVRSLVGKTL